jgi:hypothetical protein
VALVRVTVAIPAVNVRWDAGVSAAERAALERRYDLRNGHPIEGATGWQYDLGNRSPENIRALVEDGAVEDTGNIDRGGFTAPRRTIRVTLRQVWYPFSDVLDRPSQLLQLYPSVWLLLAGGAVLWAAGAPTERKRRNVTVAALILVGMAAMAFPLEPSFVEMGEAREHAENRANFERYYGGRVRFEKHLSQVILLEWYLGHEQEDAAPERAMIAVTRGATAWFVLCALAIGVVERWSAVILRYLGLALLAPSALLFFGWREFGYLSLNVATFPLLARGLRDGGPRLEAGSALSGLGAALHGSGLVGLAGAGLAALGASAPLTHRIGRALRVAAWGTAAYLGWAAIYVIVLKLPIAPDPGAAGVDPWRPWLVDEIREGRVSAAILSLTGARDLLMSAWVVGLPLLFALPSAWRDGRDEVRMALWYLPPSLIFLIFRWPFQGLAGGIELVIAGFPALYALAWVCARDDKRTKIAALLLASAHVAFWRIVLDPRFEVVQIR